MKLSNQVVEPHMVASFLMNDIARMCRQMVDQQIREIGLTRAQWYLLNFVYLYDGLSQQELADLIDLGKSNVAKQIHSLEEKGWIRRGPHESDRRSFRVHMSAEIRKTVKKLNRLVHLILQNVLSPLTPDEAQQLIGFLRAIDQQFDRDLHTQPPPPSKEMTRLIEQIKEEMSTKLIS